VNSLAQDWLYHNSHDPIFRSPFGAVCCNSSVSLGFRIEADSPPAYVAVRVWQNNRSVDIPMRLEHKEQQRCFYRAELKAPASPGLMWYHFVIDNNGQRIYYGNNSQIFGGVGQLWGDNPPAYQITVYQQAAATPSWFKEAIIYQIFVDRFYNGYPDGKIINPPRGSLIHPYWDDTPFYVRDMRTGRIFAYDFFGGNLAGVLAKLPYLKELGTSVVYFNPLFESPSNHKYDTGDYKNIDPMYGDNQLFKELCAKAKDLGMYVVLDGVFSHTGSDSIYFNKEGRYPGVGAYQSPDSPYYKWYRFSRYPDQYESWWGIDTLPNVDEMEPSYLRFIIDDEDSVLKHWLRAGIKGWRLDVADELPDAFIKLLRAAMKREDSDSILIGEVWEDASRKESYGKTREYLQGDELDCVTNYPFRNIVLDFLLGRRDAAQTQTVYLSLYENYPPEYFYSTMNLLGSHDVPRILTLLGEAPPQESMSIIEQAQYRLPAAQKQLAVARLKLAVLWQMTLPGVPTIYYGDEAGLEGYTDPFNRGTYPWGRENEDLLAWYKKTVTIRNKYSVLVTGKWRPIDVAGDVYGYIRLIEGSKDAFDQARNSNTAVVLLNRNSTEPKDVRLDLRDLCIDELIDILNGEVITVRHGWLTMTLPPLGGRLLIRREEEQASFARASGILLHVTSLPSPYGIGDLGPNAYAFVDFLAAAGQRLWQVLPLNPPGYGQSPYQCFSAFAGNHLLISPDRLEDDGLLTADELGNVPDFPGNRVDFDAVSRYKEELFRAAFARFKSRPSDVDYLNFLAENEDWLKTYAQFMALKSHFGSAAWNNWDNKAAMRCQETLVELENLLAEEIEYQHFLQYIFYSQWESLKRYANERSIALVGDMPIFVAYDSADVWANPTLFMLDGQRTPTKVAGVPPDYFSATGQLWGNPHYDWEQMAEDDYGWWRQRFSAMLKLVDIIRVDHFRGFHAYWQVDYGAETAENGIWVNGPGCRLFSILEKYLGRLPIIAEDLGIITLPVTRLREKFQFPGMHVLQFAMEEDRKQYDTEENMVIYTGTHDNDTTAGWFAKLQQERPTAARRIAGSLGADNADPAEVCRRMVDYALGSRAALAIIPLQDVIALGSEARMNLPGTVGNNWLWRVPKTSLSSALAERLADATTKNRR
jgi:4-alpha-glucanotransferase